MVRLLEQFNIKLSEKELAKFQKISESDGKIPKYCLEAVSNMTEYQTQGGVRGLC